MSFGFLLQMFGFQVDNSGGQTLRNPFSKKNRKSPPVAAISKCLRVAPPKTKTKPGLLPTSHTWKPVSKKRRCQDCNRFLITMLIGKESGQKHKKKQLLNRFLSKILIEKESSQKPDSYKQLEKQFLNRLLITISIRKESSQKAKSYKKNGKTVLE